jgi:DNA-binding response OmpR family regulator
MTPTGNRPCCLIVEDQALIGMALEAYLDEAGFQVAGPFMTNAAASAWLEDHTPDVAVVDVLLKDGPCTQLVRALRRRAVPVTIYSGLRSDSRPPELAAIPWLEKPVSRQDLANALLDMAPRPARTAAPTG